MKMKYCKTFMKTALLWAENSYAIRRKVGAVLADKTNTRVLACGYNGTLSGLPNTCEREVIVDGVRELKTPADEDAWNRGEIDVLLTHPASSAYGLNLQEGGNHVVWFGLNWNYELYTQANKRLHRQGQKEKVIIHHLVTTDSRDEDVMAALERKDDVQHVMDSLKARIRKIKMDSQI